MSMKIFLTHEVDEDLNTVHLCNELPMVIGSGSPATASFQLQHPLVAEQHCRLSLDAQGVLVEDLASVSGTYVDGEPVDQQVITAAHQKIRLGPYCLQVLSVERTMDPQFEQDDRFLTLLYQLQCRFLNQVDPNLLQDPKRTVHELKAFLDIQQSEIPLWTSAADVLRRLKPELIGYGPLDEILHDQAVTEIMVNGPNSILIEKHGELVPVENRFLNEATVIHFVQRLIQPSGRHIDRHSPLVDARLNHGIRLNAVVPPICLNGTCVTIRKSITHHLTLDDLVQQGTLSSAAANFLSYAVEAKQNIVVSGGTTSGKTTLLNVLSQSIDYAKRIITIEDTAELMLRQPHVIRLEARPPNIDGQGEITIRQLVRNALRMRPDRLVVGECRSGECLDMLQAMNTGHEGSMTTLHANSARDTFTRLETMALQSDVEIPLSAIREQIAAAIDCIVYLSRRNSDGRRQVASILDVCGIDNGQLMSQTIFHRSGEHEPLTSTGIIPKFLEGHSHVTQCIDC